MLFSEKITQVKRNVYHEQRGSEFDTATKHLINRARRTIGKTSRWKNMRIVQEPAFDTTANYTTGTATFTSGSSTVTFSGSTLINQGIEPGQRIVNTTSGGSGTVFIIESVDSETQVTINKNYDSDTGSSQTFKIFGKERYRLDLDLQEIAFLWHHEFGYPYVLNRIDQRDFYFNGYDLEETDTPYDYYLVNKDGVERQPSKASAISIVSSSNDSGDQSAAGVKVVIFGIVSGYPDQESLTLNGTTRVDGTKEFTRIDRVVKTKTTSGRITISDQVPSAGSGSTLGVIPAGKAFTEPQYTVIGLNPIPNAIIPMNLWAYKKPMDLVNDDDVSEWGNDFDQLEILLASYLGCIEERQKEEAILFKAAYDQELAIVRKFNTDVLDYSFIKKRFGASSYQHRRSAFIHPRLSYRQVGSKYGRVY